MDNKVTTLYWEDKATREDENFEYECASQEATTSLDVDPSITESNSKHIESLDE